MYRLKHMVPSEILLTIYNGLIKPHILYGLKCWGFNQGRILKLQKKAMRIICSSGYLSHSEPLFNPLHASASFDTLRIQSIQYITPSYPIKQGVLSFGIYLFYSNPARRRSENCKLYSMSIYRTVLEHVEVNYLF